MRAAHASAVGQNSNVSEWPWLIDGNNVFGSRPDGWWNDRPAATGRFAQRVAEWARTHDDAVIIVFDGPVGDETVRLGGGNLRIEVARRRGRDAADDRIVELASELDGVRVVTSDKRLRDRVVEVGGSRVELIGVGRFRELIDY
jgi:predicted RNA-binding protein with PIN domain